MDSDLILMGELDEIRFLEYTNLFVWEMKHNLEGCCSQVKVSMDASVNFKINNGDMCLLFTFYLLLRSCLVK